MASKTKVIVKVLEAGASDTTATIIPAGKEWVVRKFGGSVQAKNDGYSGNIVLMWGTEVIRPLVLYGDSREVDINRSFIGDGTTEIKVVLQNQSTAQKTLSFWYDCYEKE